MPSSHTILFAAALAVSTVSATGNAHLSSSKKVECTQHDYPSLSSGAAKNNPPTCAVKYEDLDLNRITAWSGISGSTDSDCGRCAKVCGPQGCKNLLVVDQCQKDKNGKDHIDISTGTGNGIFDSVKGSDSDVTMEWTAQEDCVGIWKQPRKFFDTDKVSGYWKQLAECEAKAGSSAFMKYGAPVSTPPASYGQQKAVSSSSSIKASTSAAAVASSVSSKPASYGAHVPASSSKPASTSAAAVVNSVPSKPAGYGAQVPASSSTPVSSSTPASTSAAAVASSTSSKPAGYGSNNGVVSEVSKHATSAHTISDITSAKPVASTPAAVSTAKASTGTPAGYGAHSHASSSKPASDSTSTAAVVGSSSIPASASKLEAYKTPVAVNTPIVVSNSTFVLPSIAKPQETKTTGSTSAKLEGSKSPPPANYAPGASSKPVESDSSSAKAITADSTTTTFATLTTTALITVTAPGSTSTESACSKITIHTTSTTTSTVTEYATRPFSSSSGVTETSTKAVEYVSLSSLAAVSTIIVTPIPSISAAAYATGTGIATGTGTGMMPAASNGTVMPMAVPSVHAPGPKNSTTLPFMFTGDGGERSSVLKRGMMGLAVVAGAFAWFL